MDTRGQRRTDLKSTEWVNPACLYSMRHLAYIHPPSDWSSKGGGDRGYKCVCVRMRVRLKGFGLEMHKERAVSRKWRTTLSGLVRGSLFDAPCCWKKLFTPVSARSTRGSGRTDPAAEGAFVSPSHLAALRNNLRSGERGARTGISLP